MKKVSSLISFILIATVIFQSLNVKAQNYVTTLTGTGTAGFLNGDTSVAEFNRPFGICIDVEGNLYLADAYNHRIRKIGIDGQVTTYAGTGTAGYLDGPADEARFNQPINICLDEDGNMFVSDFLNQRIRKISADMMVTTIAGSGQAGYLDGISEQAMFNYPRGICLDDTGNIYIGDSWNHRVRKISTTGIVSTWAGGGEAMGVSSIGDYVDASDTAARFYTPCELSIDVNNNIFVADAYNHRIRKIDLARLVSTVAGSGGFGPSGGGFQNGTATEAQFNVPTACHVTLSGSIFVGDGSNQRVRKISADGMVSTFAGSGMEGFEDGPDSVATFNFPRGTVMDYNQHRLYVVDYNNHAIRIIHLSEITETNEISTSKEFKLYPNPAASDFFLTGGSKVTHVTIQLFNSIGEVVLKKEDISALPIKIDISDLDTGLYYLNLYQGSQLSVIKKLVIVN
ncbi:MAG: T9SS type A sorting domain-containing protein [Bacteroidales bacterium]|nr:T9SS type A sorting domain-containing protein [Bacteroidales bacterium]MCF8402351.1 T9SS type A sorting domain-containing protein [Bacteroidales bacterium]